MFMCMCVRACVCTYVRRMGITNPVSTSQRNIEASIRLTSPLVATIATQDQDRLVDISEVLEAKASI